MLITRFTCESCGLHFRSTSDHDADTWGECPECGKTQEEPGTYDYEPDEDKEEDYEYDY